MVPVQYYLMCDVFGKYIYQTKTKLNQTIIIILVFYLDKEFRFFLFSFADILVVRPCVCRFVFFLSRCLTHTLIKELSSCSVCLFSFFFRKKYTFFFLVERKIQNHQIFVFPSFFWFKVAFKKNERCMMWREKFLFFLFWKKRIETNDAALFNIIYFYIHQTTTTTEKKNFTSSFWFADSPKKRRGENNENSGRRFER